MSFIDLLLNLAALLLWFHFRALRVEARAGATAAGLAGTLRRAAPSSARPWHYGLGLVALLGGRGLIYHYLGAPAGWIAKLNLGVVVLAFRSDLLPSVCVYSLLSFGRALAVSYFWLTTLVLINRRPGNTDAIHKLLEQQLGRGARWPWPITLLLPLLAVLLGWLAIQPALVELQVSTPTSAAHLFGQALLLEAALVCTLKFLLPPLLLLHSVTSYVYLGTSPAWDFVSHTAQNMLAPLKPLRLRVAKVDLAPWAAIVLVILALHWAPVVIQNRLAQHNLTCWPQ